MKKTNLLSRVLGGKARKGLMIFSLLLLFGFGFNSANAQYVSSQEATSIITSEIISTMDLMENLMQNGTPTEIERAELKLSTLRAMIQDLKKGATTKEAVDNVNGVPGGMSSLADFHLLNTKNGINGTWLAEEIVEMLSL